MGLDLAYLRSSQCHRDKTSRNEWCKADEFNIRHSYMLLDLEERQTTGLATMDGCFDELGNTRWIETAAFEPASPRH